MTAQRDQVRGRTRAVQALSPVLGSGMDEAPTVEDTFVEAADWGNPNIWSTGFPR